MTLVIDIAIPFSTISVLNAILISAIRQRNRNLDSCSEGAVSNRPSAGRNQMQLMEKLFITKEAKTFTNGQRRDK